jgi:hypothetical protein
LFYDVTKAGREVPIDTRGDPGLSARFTEFCVAHDELRRQINAELNPEVYGRPSHGVTLANHGVLFGRAVA